MIVPNQQNIKIHFAATENIPQFVSAKTIGVDYNLLTVFPFISEKIGIKSIKIFADKKDIEIPQLIHNNSNHSIMDSGLFTLMFGSHKGKKDYQFIDKWYNLLTDFIIESNYRGACVEVDCQKVLGADKAWEFRKRMQNKIKNRIINVFHLEDKQKGLDKLIEYSNYIAISVPELRFAKKKDYVVRLANYIKNKKPEIDIHLLGCTEKRILERTKFCSSADSSSWKSGIRYGYIKGNKISNIKKHVIEKLNKEIKQMSKKLNIEMNISKKNNDAILALNALIALNDYKKWCGNQN
jgi:hypothetical protein